MRCLFTTIAKVCKAGFLLLLQAEEKKEKRLKQVAANFTLTKPERIYPAITCTGG